MIKIEDIFEAYYECRKNKRCSESAIEFELDYEANCIALWREVNERTYRPTKSIAFIVTKPRMREIFAANFRDRVLQHFIDIKLRPLLEQIFIEKTCNNRAGKGTSACVEYLKDDIIEASNNYTTDCYIAKMDMQGFFMSIKKSLLTEKILAFIDKEYLGSDKEDLKWLIAILINNHPEKNCILKSSFSEWNKLDKNKSLFWIDDDLGLAIGDLISQLMANFHLNEFDHYVTEDLGFRFYGRYVDDFYIVDADKEKILRSIPLMRAKLAEIGITLHPKKFYLQHYSKGVEFVGVVIKPGRTYVHNRTVNNAFQAVKKFKDMKDIEKHLGQFTAVVNSYLGFMKNHSTYSIRRNLLKSISPDWWKYIYEGAHCYKIVIKKEYREKEIIKQKLIKQSLKHKKQRHGRFTGTN